MGTRTDRFMKAAARAAKQAKQWALAASREADGLLQEARKQAETAARRRRLKQRLAKTGRVLKAAGKAALAAALAAGVAAASADLGARNLPKRRRRKT